MRVVRVEFALIGIACMYDYTEGPRLIATQQKVAAYAALVVIIKLCTLL